MYKIRELVYCRPLLRLSREIKQIFLWGVYDLICTMTPLVRNNKACMKWDKNLELITPFPKPCNMIHIYCLIILAYYLGKREFPFVTDSTHSWFLIPDVNPMWMICIIHIGFILSTHRYWCCWKDIRVTEHSRGMMTVNKRWGRKERKRIIIHFCCCSVG